MALENVEDFYPLTPLQEGLLFHSLAEDSAAMYFNQTTARLDGPLDVAAFERAWQTAVNVHPVLRTFFVWKDVPAPVQVVQSGATMPFERLDWSDLADDEIERRFDELRHSDLESGFRLNRAPLLRLHLVRTAPEVHRLLWSFHHLLLDGWSMFHVLADVFSAYEELAAGKTPRLERPRPFRDYVAWLKRRDTSAAESFWRRRLAGFDEPSLLAEILPAHCGPHDCATEVRRLPAATSAELEALARRSRLTLATIVQGAWALLVGRYGSRRDVVHGTIVSGRPGELAGVESMVGLFINTLATRVRLPADESVAGWLTALQQSQAEAREHEFTPLSEVQGWSELPGGQPLFDSLFMFENYHKSAALEEMLQSVELGDVRWFERQHYPLAAIAIPEERFELRLVYHTDRFSQPSIERLLDHWERLLEGIARDAERSLDTLPLLTTSEERYLLSDWCGSADRPPAGRVDEIFSRQAASTPEAVACSHRGEELTYAELARQAGRLAQRLRAHGVDADQPVGVFLERGFDLVVAILATLEAGGAYLPLDLDYPAERLRWMLEDTDTRLVLTHQRLAERLPQTGATVLALDAAQMPAEDQVEPSPPSGASAESLANLIFTSGSTGRPKAVAVPHRAIVRLVRDTDFAHFGPDEVFLQLASTSFDASTLEIWAPLLNGGRLVLPPVDQPSLDELATLLREEGITTLWLSAGLFRQMVDLYPQALAGLRQLLAGGDVLPVEHVERALTALGDGRLIDGYGPTENTTFSCCHPMRDASTIEDSVPIGRPIAHSTAYILDPERLQPVPVGVPGELFVGGAGLARGYFGRPRLTAERFLPDPFSPRAGSRLYRTGDLCRWRDDGLIEFLGRADRQVKVRGFRVEPGEVEAALRDHRAVEDALVAARADQAGGWQLVAYFVPATPRPTRAELREFLRRTLPEHMLPASFLEIESIPLDANGKPDRRALPDPTAADRRSEATYAPPSYELERTIAEIWRRALELDRIGVDDNFFDLGGHSLLLLEVHQRLTSVGYDQLTMAELFEHPTVRSLARHLEDGPRERPVGSVPRPDDGRGTGRGRLAELRRRRQRSDS